MRGLVIGVLLFIFLSPLIAFHLIPTKWINEKLGITLRDKLQPLEIRVGEIKRGFPYRVSINDLEVDYKQKDLLRIINLESSVNPYGFIRMPFNLSARASVGRGNLTTAISFSPEEIRIYAETDPIEISDIPVSTRFRAVERGFARLRLWLERPEGDIKGVGLVEITGLGMKDLNINNGRFPASRVYSIKGSFRIDREGIVIKDLRVEGDGFDGVFFGRLKGRRLTGTLEIYPYNSGASALFKDFKDNKLRDELYLIPIHTDLISTLEHPFTTKQ